MYSNRKIINSIIIILAVIYLPYSVFGQSVSGGDQTLSVQLATQLALTNQLQQAPAAIKAQFAQNPLNLPPAKNEHMLKLFSKAYESKQLLSDFKSSFQNQVSGQYRDAIFQWLHTKNTQSVTNARQEFYTLQGKRKRIIAMYEMEQNAPPPEQVNLLTSHIETTSMAENSVESFAIILRPVIKALSQLSEQRNFTEAQINAIVNNFRMQMQAQAPGQIKNRLLVMYHSIETDMLENYVQFWQTDAGQWLNKTMAESMKTAYTAAAERFLQSLNTNQ